MKKTNLKNIKQTICSKGQMFIPLVCASSFFLVGYAAIDKEAPVIVDQSIVLEYGDKFDVSMINIEDNRTSYDDLDISCDTSSLREDVVGSSYVTVYATDLHNNTAQSVVEVKVEDHVAPNFELAQSDDVLLENGVVVVNLNAGNDITKYIQAYDNADGDVTAFIESKGNFDSGSLDPQSVTLSVSDSSGNTNTKTFDIQVKDITAPTIELTKGEEVDVDYGSEFHVTDFAKVTDNSNEDIQIQLSNGIDTSKEDETQVVTLIAKDSAGNETTKELKVNVKDQSAPIINASNIEISEGDSLDIRSSISVVDNKDGDLTSSATIDGSVNTNSAGDYSVTIRATDSEGNESSKTITVTVKPKGNGAVSSIALQYNGSPYVYGASGPYAFDCSGFTSYVYAQAGISIGRTTYAQYAGGTKVSDLQPGDLLFFNTVGSLGHVGIYLGNGQMIHAGTSATGVQITSINSAYWQSTYAGAVRY